MRVLNVAEKPSVAKEVSRLLSEGSARRRDGRSRYVPNRFSPTYPLSLTLPYLLASTYSLVSHSLHDSSIYSIMSIFYHVPSIHNVTPTPATPPSGPARVGVIVGPSPHTPPPPPPPTLSSRLQLQPQLGLHLPLRGSAGRLRLHIRRGSPYVSRVPRRLPPLE